MDTIVVLAGIFTGLSVLVSCFTLYRHLSNFTMPNHQKYICRILLLVPVYGVLSLLSLLSPPAAIALGTLRDCYEAFVIYTFFQLLMEYLGGEEAIGEWMVVQGHVQHSQFVQQLCPKRRNVQLGPQFLRSIRQGILQFVFIKPFTAILALLFSRFSLYSEGSYAPGNSYLYISVVNNVSVTISLYCLVLFYLATESILKPFKPLAKFAVVKCVVFFSYWQYCALQVLHWIGILPVQEQVFVLQSSLICIEMFLAAIAHHFAFSANDYVPDESGRSQMFQIIHKHSVCARRHVDRDEEEEEDYFEEADVNSTLIPKLFKVLDGRDVIQDGRNAFLDRQNSDAELEDQPVV